jgi:hypothetical protein
LYVRASHLQVNLRRGINRFYVVQLLQLGYCQFEVFCHWGKVGVAWFNEVGKYGVKNFNVYSYSSKEEAIESFKKWFLKKGGTPWEQRRAFVPKPEHYNLVELSRVKAGGTTTEHELSCGGGAAGGGGTGTEYQLCSLTAEVASLVELLFDEDIILNSMKEANVNTEELPLGSVTSERILRCSELLAMIRVHLEVDNEGVHDLSVWSAQLEQFSTEFFTQLPCRDVKLIDTKAEVVAREKVVNMMLDIAVGQGLLKGASSLSSSPSSSSTSSSSSSLSTVTTPLELHPLDKKAQSLACDLVAVDKASHIFKTIETSFENTATPAVPNCLAGFKMPSSSSSSLSSSSSSSPPRKVPKVVEVFEMQRHGEEGRFAEGGKFASMDNVKLLWYG